MTHAKWLETLKPSLAIQFRSVRTYRFLGCWARIMRCTDFYRGGAAWINFHSLIIRVCESTCEYAAKCLHDWLRTECVRHLYMYSHIICNFAFVQSYDSHMHNHSSRWVLFIRESGMKISWIYGMCDRRRHAKENQGPGNGRHPRCFVIG